MEGNSTPNLGSDTAAEVGAIDHNLSHDCSQDSGTEAGNVKISGMNDLIGPFFRMLARTSSYKQKLSKNICKQVLEERNEWTKDSQLASTSGMSLRCAAFKDDFHAGILDGQNIEVSFDNFPYYLRYNFLLLSLVYNFMLFLAVFQLAIFFLHFLDSCYDLMLKLLLSYFLLA
jgi:hypothetical protein